MDDLRAAVDRALALTPATRLIAIDAGDLVDATALEIYAAFGGPAAAARRAVADPLRLPLVEGLADLVLARIAAIGEPQRRLREIWRILAPAGAVILVVAMPRRYSFRRLFSHAFFRHRLARWLAATMFAAVSAQATEHALLVRLVKRDGLAPPAQVTVTVQRPLPV